MWVDYMWRGGRGEDGSIDEITGGSVNVTCEVTRNIIHNTYIILHIYSIYL